MALVPVIGILTLVFLAIITVAGVVGSILFLAGRPMTGVRRVGGSIAMVCGSVVVMAFLLGFAVIGVVRVSPQKFEHARQHDHHRPLEMPGPPHPPGPRAVLIDAGDHGHGISKVEAVPRNLVDAGLSRLPETEETQPADALKSSTGGDNHGDPTAATSPGIPDWVKAGTSKIGDVQHDVLTSQQYATRDEVRQDLARKAAEHLSKDYRYVYRETAYALKKMEPMEIKQLAVRNEIFEETKTDFGNFTAPMYRGYWQVELSPQVRVNLRQLGKAQVQESRVLTVGGTLAGITVVLAGLSLLTRRRHAVMG